MNKLPELTAENLPAPPVFATFDEAADWTDRQTTPENAGRFLIEPSGSGWQVSVMPPPAA